MFEKIANGEIEKELSSISKTTFFNAGISQLPLGNLSDREFELLAYDLLRAEIRKGSIDNIDDIAITKGVADRGRDCVLYKAGIVVGLVQCKKYDGRISRPLIIREIIKFLLYSILDKKLLPDPSGFTYAFYCSGDFTDPAHDLLKAFSDEISVEISTGALNGFVQTVIQEYEAFSTLLNSPPVAEITDLIQKISTVSANGQELNLRLLKHSDVVQTFFQVKAVVDVNAAGELLRKILNEHGVKLHTDADLVRIKDRIEATSKENRVNLGYVDFFGYCPGFFRFLKGKDLQELMELILKVRSFLDSKQMDFALSEIHTQVLAKVTNQLLLKKQIHPFSVQIAPPYLFERISRILISGSLPKELQGKYHPTCSKEDLLKSIFDKLLDTSEKVLKKNFSEFVGSPSEVEFKKCLYEKMHSGVTTTRELSSILTKDIPVLLPVLDEIEIKLQEKLSSQRTIIISDVSFLDSDKEIKKFFETLKKID